MRNQFLMGKIHVNYPDEVAFTNDRNTINLQYTGANNESVGGAFTFTNTAGKTAEISYNSEQSYLTFNLFSVLKKMINGDNYEVVTVTGSVVCGETSINISPFVLKLVDGRTLHSRQHCSETIIYYYDDEDLNGFEILSLEGGTINGYTVQSGISKLNLTGYSGEFEIVQTDGDNTHTYTVKKSSIGGDDDYCVEEGGGDDDVTSGGGLFRVRYLNIDGCHRYLVGKITSRKRTVGYTDWRADELVRHTPNGMITTTTDEITVGFPAIARKSYAEDIMFSPTIEYVNESGEWQPCILSSKNINLPNWDENDIEITFKTLA